MRLYLLVLFVYCASTLKVQGAESRSSKEFPLKKSLTNDDARAITDVWENIKKTAKDVWNSIKNVAQNVRNRIENWLENVKNRASVVLKNFEDRLEELKAQSRKVLDKLVGTGTLVKKCFETDNEAITELLEQVIKYVTNCISDSLKYLDRIQYNNLRIDLNETTFVENVEQKLNNCAREKNIEECLTEVRKKIYDDMNEIEWEILKNSEESRSIADDVLDSILSCSIEGVIDASDLIATLVVNTIECVKKDDNDNETSINILLT